MNAKQCKQCGELKPIEQYRKYYGGRKGSYTTCKSCEKINSRAKYLTNKGEACDESGNLELLKIKRLWEAQRKAGLQPPRENTGCRTSLVDTLDDMISRYSAQTKAVEETLVGTDWKPIYYSVPVELSKWLLDELNQEPDYYQDEVYEQLKNIYRPKLSIDQDTMLPVYDDTYKGVLDKILERFNEYEDNYYDNYYDKED